MIAILALAALAAADTPELSASNYTVNEPMPKAPAAKPDWSDEFSGSRLDRSKWRFDTSRNKVGWYNGELQYYSADRPQNLRLEGGRLIIELRRDAEQIRSRPDYGGQAYSSAKIMTQRLASWTYGYYEVRAKLPCARGTWPAIWLLPERDQAWPEGGEIDVMEMVGSQPDVVHGTLHTGLFNHRLGTQRGAEVPVPTSCTQFHNYQLSWTPDEITIGVDGHAYMRVKNNQPGGHGAWPFDQPFYMILNLAMGGDWAGAKGIDVSALPQRMEVDYVRVWKTGGGRKAKR